MDEYIRLDTTIIGIDSLINKAPTAEEAKVLFTAKNVIYSQQRYVMDVQPVKHGKDVMKVLQQVSDTCERTRMCMECEFYSKNSGICVFADMPIFWKHEEIEKALKDGEYE